MVLRSLRSPLLMKVPQWVQGTLPAVQFPPLPSQVECQLTRLLATPTAPCPAQVLSHILWAQVLSGPSYHPSGLRELPGWEFQGVPSAREQRSDPTTSICTPRQGVSRPGVAASHRSSSTS